MTLAIFFGCTFIAFGPTLGLFLFTIARDLLRIIILIAGSVPHRCRAFFWLVSLLLSSLIWFITVKVSDPQDEPLQKGLLIFGVMFSVLLQEAFRFLYYKLLRGVLKCQNMRLMGTGESRLEQLVGACQEIVNFSKR
ncbi:gamma-secretase subunit Aph-1b-like [Falco peregrinus]|uniref:gamma-secretase subunit Aph-1b-like n=1 Tax=Falco peregrinus TaxID=8954 RepID=UPI00247A572F|nr:gamma-secretase subunit Aph-1b-like [Falco peregrinus]